MKNEDFDIPERSSEEFKKVCNIVRDHIIGLIPNASGGGCKAFHTPEDWKARGEKYGLDSVAVIVHDGGDMASFFNYDYQRYDFVEGMQKALNKHEFYVEQCTGWYSAIYKS